MLGLLRGHHGNDASPFKNGSREPVVNEVIPSPISERSEQQNGLNATKQTPSHEESDLLSPTPSLTNGVRVNKRQSSYTRSTGMIRTSYGHFTNTLVQQEHTVVRRKCQREYGANVGEYVFNTSFTGLRQWIKSERLMRLPHKGGSWDRVLVAAQYFAEQVHHFSHHIETFTTESGGATNFVFGQCLLLLELGHENASALEKAFNLFYQFGLELSPLSKRFDLFQGSDEIKQGLSRAFAALLQIVTAVSITFYQAVHSGREFTRVDIFATFSSMIQMFRTAVHKCSHEMWNVALAGRDDGCQIDDLQKWLAPQDSVLAFLASNHIDIACQPEQFTCTWFKSPLEDFLKSSKDILLVEGKIGSGKTTLASWVVDRLQRPIARKHVSTVSFFFDYNIAAQSTPLAMLRTFMYQLLSVCVGNLRLFNAANEALIESAKVLTGDEQEKKMWLALNKALQAVSEEQDDTLVLIVDGVTESDTVMVHACQKLHELARKYSRVRLIQFSQPLNQKVASSERVQLSTENLIDDLRTVVRRRLHVHAHFQDRVVGDQEEIIEQIVGAADGSMLWTYLTCKLLQRQNSCKDFDERLKEVMKGSKTIAEIVKKLYVSLELENDDKTLLTLLVAAERPLQRAEAEALLLAETKKLSMADRPVKLGLSMSHISAFTVSGEGLVTIRHDAIRQALIGLNVDAAFAQQLKSRHQDMLMRLLIYTKSCLRVEQQVTLTCLDAQQAESRLSSHMLLEYSVRYWASHYKRSVLYKVKGDLQLPNELKQIFSDSITFCLLEQACWNAQAFAADAFELHSIAYRVRKAVFGEKHGCVLQSALFCAILCESVLSQHTEAAEWYALTAKLSSTICGVQSDITVLCCNTLLRISASMITKKRTTIMTYREEILLILVKSCTHRFGSSSKEVVEIYKQLRELYIHIEEETKVVEIEVIIGRLTGTVDRHRPGNDRRISRQGTVILQKHEHVGPVPKRDGFLFFGFSGEVEEELTIVHIDIIIKRAAEFIVIGNFVEAEELYIELWLKLTEHCHTHDICEWHEKKIQVMLIYARFLEVRKRRSEATAILVAIWSEYEHHSFLVHESMIAIFKEVALFMKEVSLYTTALLVFHKCWAFYKERHEHTLICKEIEEYISETSIKVTETTTIDKTESTTVQESVMKFIFEESIKSSETISVTTVKYCKSLVHIYRKEERWSEAVTCIKQLLVRSWSSFFSESIESVVLVESFLEENIELVISLAECYIYMKRFEMAEDIYLRIYRAHRRFGLDDARVLKYRAIILQFYAQHSFFTKEISFYQELLVEYRARHGITHSETIKILYALGKLCRQHYTKYGYWLEYYLEIVVNLNKGRKVCHWDAFDALLIVAEHYYESLRFFESLSYYECIFETFCEHGKEWVYFREIKNVRILVEHYFRSITESKVEIHRHIEILKKLRHACIHVYGESHELTVHVTVTLAETYSRSEHSQFEAIELYEVLLRHESSSVSVEIKRRIEISLKTLYVKKVQTSTTITKVEIEQATKLVYKRYLEVRRESSSCTQSIVLTHLRELVMLYHKQWVLFKMEGVLQMAYKELRSIIVDILKITMAKELIEAAITIAAIYISCGWKEEGMALIREFKLQIIYKSKEGCSHWGFDVTSCGRTSFAFIATFEYHLRALYTMSLTVCMSDLVAEYLFYGRFTHFIEIKAGLEKVMICGARLRQIYVRTDRLIDFSFIEKKVLHYFTSTQTSVVSIASKHSITVFISVLLGYYSKHVGVKNWVAAAGHAAVNHIQVLLREHKHKEAQELTLCTYKFLMAHEGLDDPTEITLGFQLCLLMAGRTPDKTLNAKCSDSAVKKSMMDLSRTILSEVLDICVNFKEEIDLAQCQLVELNALIILLGEQRDFKRLQWLLNLLWKSREGQKTWGPDTVLFLGKRLVQAQFAAGRTTEAIRLCENIVYNVRRVHGLRHHHTVTFQRLLASMYTSLALKHVHESQQEGCRNKKHAEDMARLYFKKAVQVHEDALKQIVNADDADNSDCDDDESDFTDVRSDHRFNGVNGNTNGTCGFAWKSQQQEINVVRAHIRRLQLALQRYGGFVRHSSDYERLTGRVWDMYSQRPDFRMSEQQVLASKWKVDGYGMGKAEGEHKEDAFKLPEVWWVVEEEA